jgi:hypothetical protein
MMCLMSDGRRLLTLAHAVAAVLVLVGRRDAPAATFSDVTTAAGISYFYDPKPPFTILTEEFQSGGAAAGDFDNDGWVDLYVTRYYAPDILYRNNGNGTFSDVTTAAFGNLPTRNTNGAGWGDIDKDGDLDLYVSSVGQLQHFLYINDGSGHFSEQAAARGAAVSDGVRTTAGTSVSFGDYDNDGWLDLYVGEWRVDQSVPAQARLLRNLGAANPGHFEDTTDPAGVNMDLTTGYGAYQSFSLTPRFVDFDRDGHQDIAVASDFHTTRMFWNNGDGTFADGTSSSFIGEGDHNRNGLRDAADYVVWRNGVGGGYGPADYEAWRANFANDARGNADMGFAVGDVNGDGLVDWFNTDIYIAPYLLNGNRLFLNNGDRTFTDATTAGGVRDAGYGWGTEMFDYDNDGDLDIIATNGYTDPPAPADRVRFFENNGAGVFAEKAIFLGITNIAQGRGLLTFDYDNDGDLDVFIVNNHQAPVLYRNNGGNANDWLKIKTVGTTSNTDGVGAFITVTPDLAQPDEKLVWEVSGSSSYLGQSEKTAHFGLGPSAEPVDLVEIEWLASGIVQQFTDVAPNQLLIAVELLGAGPGRGGGAGPTMIPEPTAIMLGILALLPLCGARFAGQRRGTG